MIYRYNLFPRKTLGCSQKEYDTVSIEVHFTQEQKGKLDFQVLPLF